VGWRNCRHAVRFLKQPQRQGRRIEGDNIMINCTPHAITLRTPQGDITIPPSGTVARVTMTEAVVRTCAVTGVDVIRRTPGEVIGLPEDGTPCIVSAMVLAALPAGTKGVFAPDTGATAVRNDRGHIVAVTRLVAA
jgi:hypothetical protein